MPHHIREKGKLLSFSKFGGLFSERLNALLRFYIGENLSIKLSILRPLDERVKALVLLLGKNNLYRQIIRSN